MRLFSFLSKFTFICNVAFLLFAFFRWMERRKPVSGSGEMLSGFPILKELIIVLGFSAIVINVLMNIFYLFFLIKGKFKNIPVRLPVINFIFLIVQLIYFSTNLFK